MRTAVVTGVGRGLGKALAERLIESGHAVYGTTNRSAPDLTLAGHATIDLADPDSISSGLDSLVADLDSLDLLINCAGIDARALGSDESDRGPFSLDAETMSAVFNVNVNGPMLATNRLLPLLERGSDPLIVNVSSQLGSMQVAQRKGRDTAYCVSKAALNMLSVKSAAALRDRGVSVVMLHPGWVQTDMGGPSAPLTIDTSADAIITTIAGLTLADSGRFIRWDGHDHPW